MRAILLKEKKNDNPSHNLPNTCCAQQLISDATQKGKEAAEEEEGGKHLCGPCRWAVRDKRVSCLLWPYPILFKMVSGT